jgi:hypothetical protein
MATAYARQLLRDERAPRVERIKALMAEIAGCFEAERYEAGLVMQFIELDTWAYLSRPESMTKHGRSSFNRFISKYLQSDPDQPYQYAAEDVYATRCGLLHTFGSISDLHQDNSSVIWRFHLGKCNTYIPGLDRMAYISVRRFWLNASQAVARCLDEVKADPALNELVGSRLPRVYFQAGVLPSRDPDALAVIEPAIDAEIVELERRVSAPKAAS